MHFLRKLTDDVHVKIDYAGTDHTQDDRGNRTEENVSLRKAIALFE